jgi:predicted kinase
MGDNPSMERPNTHPRLIIVCGLPGSGKTTLSKMLESRLRAIRLSADDWLDALTINLHREDFRGKIEALQWKFAQDLLDLGLTVIIEWGTWARSERDALRLRARDLGAAVELHYLFAPADVLFARIQDRARENPPVERDAISRWVESFQVPTSEEMALFDTPLFADIASTPNETSARN